MRVFVNGTERCLADGATVAAVVAAVVAAPAGVAVAVNDDVVPRGGWATRVLRERDRVEVLTAVQGG